MPRSSFLRTLRRPKLLAKAARAGLSHYVREIHLAAILPGASSIASDEALIRQLKELEADIDAARCAQTADYSIRKHVAVLVALLAEANPAKTRPA